ncbi:DUF4381 family protein [Ferruginibacter sp.]|uniref:DUF4381 family protein n=1 Tax=Ferruginibacter sp. TaxID=1940288 RepID=UPI002657D310|nr:DUF4381 family protein [Ferruginibacter sp.]
MDNRKMRRILLTVAISSLAFLFCTAQPVVRTTIDKSEILIGEQFKLKVQANFSGDDYFIKWIALPDSMQHFELVEKSKIDSVFTNQKLSGLTQTFTLTSFDSGKWTFPSYNINFNPAKDDTTITMFTDSLPVTVAFSVADTTSALKDIKAIKEVEVFNPLWYWVAGGALIILLLALIYWWYRTKKKSKTPVQSVSKLSPFEEAMQEIDKLKNFDLSEPKDIKQYHTKLIEIYRQYLSRKENTDYSNKTTGDMLIAIKSNYAATDILDKSAAALRFSNAVKFAKYVPLPSDSENNQRLIKDTIRLIESSPSK